MKFLKKYSSWILSGIILVLAVILIGVLVFMKNQPAQERAFEPLVEIELLQAEAIALANQGQFAAAERLLTDAQKKMISYVISSVVIAVATPLGLFLIFERWLKVSLPRGFLGF